MTEWLYLNGSYMPLAEGRVSVEDRGFLFGDGIYEVIRCYNGRPFRMREHLGRLKTSAAAIDLAIPLADEAIASVCDALGTRSGLREATIYLQITRGPAPRSHAFPKVPAPTFMAFIRPLAPPSPAQREAGISLISIPDDRWGRCHIKSLNLLANVLAKQKAVAAGAYEGLFVRDGIVTEGTVSNAFAVIGGTVFTHPADNRILHGVTRAAVLEVARASGCAVREEKRSLDDFLAADEVFLTGTTVEVLGVSAIDGKPIGASRPGPVTRRLHQELLRLAIPAS
jgi:D-alanine transaminase